MKILFYDLETTGLDHTVNAILQLGCILIDYTEGQYKYIDSISLEMRPLNGQIINSGALKANGYTISQIQTFRSSGSAFCMFCEWLTQYRSGSQKFLLAGYNNSAFDNAFFRDWWKQNTDRYFGTVFYNSTIDVYSESCRFLIEYLSILPNMKLGTVAAALEVKPEGKLHNALVDVDVTYKIFKLIQDSDCKILTKTADTFNQIMTRVKDIPKYTKRSIELEKSLVWNNSLTDDDFLEKNNK